MPGTLQMIWRAKDTGATFKPQKTQRGRRSHAGHTVLEITLITPLMLAMLAGVIYMGRYTYIGIIVGNAARAGAAYGGKRPGDTAGITNAGCNDFLGNLGSNPGATCDASGSTGTNHLNVTSTTSCGCDNGGTVTAYGGACNNVPNTLPSDPIPACQSGGGAWVSTVTVTASGTFNTLFYWPGVPTTMTITKQAQIRATP